MANKQKEKKRFSLTGLLYNDKALVVISVLLALVIWIAVSMNLSPETTKTISVPVTIDFSGTLAEQLGIEYYGETEITVEVTVSCQKYMAMEIDSDDITATLQTSTITSSGYHSVPISVQINSDSENSSDFEIESYSPTSAEGYYDISAEATLPVEVSILGEGFVEEGYVLGDVSLSADTVTVTGPETYVNAIESIIAEVDYDGETLSESQVVTLDPKAYDENGNEVSYVTVITADDGLTATIPILKVVSLPVSVNISNMSDDDEDLVSISYSPEEIEVGVLSSSSITSLVVGEIDFDDLEEGDNEFEFAIADISGVTAINSDDVVTVTVTLEEE